MLSGEAEECAPFISQIRWCSYSAVQKTGMDPSQPLGFPSLDSLSRYKAQCKPGAPLLIFLCSVTWACQVLECAQHGLNCRPSLPAPMLALAWDGLSLHAHVAEDRLQRLTVSLAGCAVQRAVQSASPDPPGTSAPRLEEARSKCTRSDACIGLYPVDARLQQSSPQACSDSVDDGRGQKRHNPFL